jgi:murein tripeptide amidase MpaA
MRTLRVIVALLLLPLLGHSAFAPVTGQQAPEKKSDPFPGWNQRIADTNLDFRHYYPLEEVDETCEMLARRFPELVSMREIGRSFQDRPIYCVTLCARRTGAHDTKPAMYIDSNIHGNEIQGTEIILVTIWYLLRNYGHEPWVTNLVDTRTFYFVPVVNPDSRHHWFAEPNSPHSLRGNHRPFDDDRDGEFDEDPPNDLNGDGVSP